MLRFGFGPLPAYQLHDLKQPHGCLGCLRLHSTRASSGCAFHGDNRRADIKELVASKWIRSACVVKAGV